MKCSFADLDSSSTCGSPSCGSWWSLVWTARSNQHCALMLHYVWSIPSVLTMHITAYTFTQQWVDLWLSTTTFGLT